MNNISKNIKTILSSLPKTVTLVAVSKTKPVEDIKKAYQSGQRIFGENKVQEMVKKYEILPKDIEWHLIGHLQTNKVKYIAPFVSLIQTVDSIKLLKEINKQALKNKRIITCLLEVKIAQEDTKMGLSINEVQQLINRFNVLELKNVKIIGLMGMATNTSDKTQIENEFKYLNDFFKKLQTSCLPTVSADRKTGMANHQLQILSMGMSNDYQIAIDNGSNMIRIGSTIFGERNHN